MDNMPSPVAAAQKLHPTAIEAQSEIEREMEVRSRIYDKWVKDGKMSWADARDRFARMMHALVIVKRVAELEDQVEEPFTPEVVNG